MLSGSLLGCAFPPADWKWLAWVGLVPLLWALQRADRLRHAFLLGSLAGFIFFLLTLHPLVSAHSWTGWAAESPEAFASRMSRQWWFMQGIWVAFAMWCALFWGLWALTLHRLSRHDRWGRLLVAPSAWVVLPEWARAQTTFGFAWAFLGNATADLVSIRQLAALGGIWLLSALVVAVNVGLAELFQRRERPGWWRVPAAACGLAALAAVGGAVYARASNPPRPTLVAAALQHYKSSYTTQDFLEIGLDRSYLRLIEEAIGRRADLIVLPESIALGAVTLDGSASQAKPPEWQHPRARWDAQMRHLLAKRPSVLVVGLDTVERGEDHNTLVAWNAEGPIGWYHKRRLVPFSEYRPSGWGAWAIRGRSQYAPGRGSQPIHPHTKTVGVGVNAPAFALGGFICQEVLIPWVTRESVREGATILVSGGNDGVFSDPAVAQVHADVAQLRAVETGRYLVRAMKTGLSAIIDPHGRELIRTSSSEPALLVHPISPMTGQTPYVRFGDWVVWLAIVLLGARLAYQKKGQAPFEGVP